MEDTKSYTVNELISQDYNQPMNKALILNIQYAFFIIIFGIWYYNAFVKSSEIKENLAKKTIALFLIPLTYILIAAGYLGQLVVDAIINLLKNVIPQAFSSYDAMLNDILGASFSWAMLIAVFILAPIGEELLFRGVLQGYLLKAANKKTVPYVIIAQGLIFGIYHGNLVQCVYASVLGIFLGLIAYRYNSILPSIVFHMAINISVILIPKIFFAATPNTIITGIVSLTLFVICCRYILFHKGQGDKKEA